MTTEFEIFKQSLFAIAFKVRWYSIESKIGILAEKMLASSLIL